MAIIQNLSLIHDKPQCFVRSEWQNTEETSWIYLTYRWVMVAFFSIFTIYSLALSSIADTGVRKYFHFSKWFIYLTHWGYAYSTFQLTLNAVMVTGHRFSKNPEIYLKPYKVYWLSHTITLVAAEVITILYWTFLFRGEAVSLINLCHHVFNSVFLIIDLFAVSHPYRIMHGVYPVIFGILYTLFTVIYFIAGGTNLLGQTYIYPIIQWNKKGLKKSSIIIIIAMTGIIVFHVFNWLLVKLRTYLHKKLSEDGNVERTLGS